ncbi:unnamed protein product [Didymodactylos carnosus]|uniref:Uncharacterized protein n=1 Tax=Didymodactylos carnosus TaxID=1234261 RepID=A0A813NT80_9BILA|nr:unnamed protein product [Didymodactylos carnosus]CAF1534761.1 unnamed protein product [Didymodactylos carnosus]CAF3522855.1 unnamed protein product [Didymodactylos carnosus]CAF4322278.1 unnamed protein product [Didymodactylos carnosus]
MEQSNNQIIRRYTSEEDVFKDKYPVRDERIYHVDINGLRVPQNVRHRFRSKITDQLLCDNCQVNDALKYIDIQYVPNRSRLSNHTEQIRPMTSTGLTSTSLLSLNDPHQSEDYYNISNDLRNSVCHGFPVKRSSHSKNVHNAQLVQEHFSSTKNFNSAFRRKKDWLGTYYH